MALRIAGMSLLLSSIHTSLAQEAPVAPYPNQDLAMRAAAQKYPELVGEPRHGTYSLEMVLRSDGSIYDSKLSFLTESRIQNSVLPIATMRDNLRRLTGNGRVIIDEGQAVADVGEASGEIQAMWVILPEGYDESRTAGRVNDLVLATHRDYLLPTRDEMDPDRVFTNVNRLTILMTEDGQIAQEALESITIKELLAMEPRPLSPGALISRVLVPAPVPLEAFEPLGLDAEQIGQTGVIVVQAPLAQPESTETMQAIRAFMDALRFRPLIAVRYAWPRRPGEPIGGYPQPNPAP